MKTYGSSDLIEFRLGPEAIDFIRRRLSRGKTFCDRLLRTLDLDLGTVSTYLPPGTDAESIRLFEWGGKLPPDHTQTRYVQHPEGRRYRIEAVPNTNLWLAEEIHNYLAGDLNRACLFEDGSARPSDPWLAHAQVTYMIHEEGVYFPLIVGESSSEKIEGAIRCAGGAYPGLLGAFTSTAAKWQVESGAAISDESLADLARRTVALVVGAYDGEAYLMWKADTSEPG